MDKTYKERNSSFGRLRDDLCSRHNSPLNAYCCTDETVICASCATSDHNGHMIGLVTEERRRKQDEIRNLKKKFQELLESEKAQVVDQIQEKASETDDFCEAVLTEVIDVLQTCYMSLRELIQARRRSAVSLVQKQRSEVKKRCTELDCLTHNSNDVHFLLKWPSVHQRCQKNLSDFTDSLFCPFESLKSTVDSFGHQLQDICSGFSRTWKDHLEPDESLSENQVPLSRDDSFDLYEVTGCDIKATEPQTREEFLQYACELTMDPNTAHEDLLLSHDLKEVRLAPISTRFSAVRRPERFLNRRQLLCSQGLHTENFYFEIEVTGGSAEIALAYESIDRKSRIKQAAFGMNANSWSLDRRSAGYSVSHKGESVELTSVPECSRVGVYLKWSAGTVTFYEVSNTMKYLYKLQTEFTEKLYPGFWIEGNCRIKICDLSQPH